MSPQGEVVIRKVLPFDGRNRNCFSPHSSNGFRQGQSARPDFLRPESRCCWQKIALLPLIRSVPQTCWLQPIRHTLGAVYLMDERYEDAERVYREDLSEWPNNGWSLFGLMRSLELQDRTDEAAEIRVLFEHAWRDADNPLTTSCECIPEL